METDLISLVEDILHDRGIPRTIKLSLEKSLHQLAADSGPQEERLSSLLAVLDEASADPNVSVTARTQIWNAVSVLENIMSQGRT